MNTPRVWLSQIIGAAGAHLQRQVNMKRFLPLFVGLLLALPTFGSEKTELLAGIYQRGDHTGYNVTLNLKPEGMYDARWTGCLGLYGTAEGNWTISDGNLILSPTKETGTMKNHLKVLKIRKVDEDITLLPDKEEQMIETENQKRRASFKKTVDAKKPNQTLE